MPTNLGRPCSIGHHSPRGCHGGTRIGEGNSGRPETEPFGVYWGVDITLGSIADPEMRTTVLIAFTSCVLLLACSSAPRRTDIGGDVRAVERVVEAFRKAIVDRDKTTYMSLFFSDKPEEIGWQAVVDDARLRAVKETRPQAIKARRIPTNNFVSLIDSVVASKTIEEERISNVRVNTDGEVASAAFDYVYLSDGRAINRGSEHWQLVRTENGWKIFSVIYTIRDPSGGA